MIQIQVKKHLSSALGQMWLDVNLTVQTGSLLALGGSSGSGKTTLLRILAGLESVREGFIQKENEPWLDTSKRFFLPPQKRRTGFVFQEYSLFPNMTVAQNLSYALQKGQPADEINELIEIMELQALTHRYPEKLSGGQKQRVALARALVPRPRLLLLDEPLSALDPPMRLRLQDYILEVHKRYQLTTIMVTHDLNEVLKMADTVVSLEQGKIVKMGTPAEVFLKDTPPARNCLKGFVIDMDKQMKIAYIRVNDQLVQVSVPEHSSFHPGDEICLEVKGVVPTISEPPEKIN